MSVQLKAGDLFPDIEATVTDENGNVVDVSGATITCSVRHSRKPTTKILDGGVGLVVDGPNGQIAYRWSSGETEVTPATYEAEFLVTPVVGDPFRVPTVGYIPVNIYERIGTV